MVYYDATSLIYNDAEAAHPSYGLGITLWVGVALVCLSYLAAFSITFLEAKAEVYHRSVAATAALTADVKENVNVNASPAPAPAPAPAKAVTFGLGAFIADARKLPPTFWVLCLIITFFYNLALPHPARSRLLLVRRPSSPSFSAAGRIWPV